MPVLLDGAAADPRARRRRRLSSAPTAAGRSTTRRAPRSPRARRGRQVELDDVHVLAVVGRPVESDADNRILDAFARELTSSLELEELTAEASEAGALAAAGDLRTAILSAVSHDLRTPLSAIKASVTSLLQEDVEWTPDARHEFLAHDRRGVRPTQRARRQPARHEPAPDRSARRRPVGRSASTRSSRPRSRASAPEPPRSTSTSPRPTPRARRPGAARAGARQRDRERARPQPAGRARARRRRRSGRRASTCASSTAGPACRRAIARPSFCRSSGSAIRRRRRSRTRPRGRERVRRGDRRRLEIEDTPGGGLTMVVPAQGGDDDADPRRRRRAAAPARARHEPEGARLRGRPRDRPASSRSTLAARHHPDLVVLDLGLPGIDGIEVIQGLRGWTQVPIIVLSVREGERDKVAALDAGADDYVTKPFGMDELLARLRAALRRAAPADESRRGRHAAISRSTSPPSASRTRPARCASRRPSGRSSRSSSATRASWSRSGSCCTRSGGRSTRPRRTTSASTWPRSGASSSRTRRGRGRFITEARMGYRFDPPAG